MALDEKKGQEKTLGDYDIKEGSCVHLLLKLTGC